MGDNDLERLFRDEYPRLVHAISIVLGDVDSAADAVQDAFLQASRHWTRVSTYESPRHGCVGSPSIARSMCGADGIDSRKPFPGLLNYSSNWPWTT